MEPPRRGSERRGDARFARVHADPRFHRPRRSDTKVTLDERFRDVLQPRKADTLKMDRFGRSAKHSSEADELRRLYRLEGEDERPIDYARGEMELESSSEEEDEDEDEASEEDGDVVIGGADARSRAHKLASAGDESDASIDLDEDYDEEAAAALDREARERQAGPSRRDDVARGDDTCRLAVVNMDWDYVHARDLYKVFSSIVSPTAMRAPLEAAASAAPQALAPVRGQVLSVRVYMSDFGRERLAREDVEGPPREIFKGGAPVDDDAVQQVDEGEEFNEDALRKYQLERLRYYYAIATFDSKESARHVYNEIDGTEMERSANMFDLRFVPNDMDFPDGENGRPAEFRDEATDDTGHYEGLDFKTDALRHSKVRLTWDQDDPHRARVTHARDNKHLHEDDIKTYLASSDEEPEEEASASRGRLRALLSDMPSKSAFDDADDEDSMFAPKAREGDMQISFMPALTSKPAEEPHEETTIEKYLRKQKEKRMRRRERAREAEAPAEAADDVPADEHLTFDDPFFADERDMDEALAEEVGEKRPQPKEKRHMHAPRDEEEPGAVSDDGNASDEQHFNLQDIVRSEKLQGKKMSKAQRKREARRAAGRQALVQPSFEIDTKDPRFAAVMDDHRFAIDPHHPGFVKTAGMQKLIDEGNRRRAEQPAGGAAEPDLAALVSSVKRRADAPRKKQRR